MTNVRSARTGTDRPTRLRLRVGTGVVALAISATLVTSAAAGQDLTAAGSGAGTGVGTAVLTGGWSSGWSGWAASGWTGTRDPYGSDGSGYGSFGFSSGGSDSTGSSSGSGTSTAAASTATTAESRGLVLIDTVLPYEDAEGAGTGMVLTANGEVLTNYHVVEGASTIKVTVATTGKTYSARVVGSDATDDVALLQLTRASGLSPVTLGGGTAATGDPVTAVGNAGGTGTLTAAAGSIGSLSATITTAAEGPVASETLTGLIRTDADVVAGDSGGPLYDARGEVVGMDTAASSGAEVDSYAIPVARAMSVVSRIRSGSEGDGVRIGPAAFLGVEVTDAATAATGWDPQPYGSDPAGNDPGNGTGDDPGTGDATSEDGALVAGVVSGSAAAKAGLVAGDVITAIGGTTVTAADQVSTLLGAENPGDRVTVHWTDTDGATHTMAVTLGSSPVA